MNHQEGENRRLEATLRSWRHRARGHGMSPAEVEELEDHLRQLLTSFTAGGMPLEEAFPRALRELGDLEELSAELRGAAAEASLAAREAAAAGGRQRHGAEGDQEAGRLGAASDRAAAGRRAGRGARQWLQAVARDVVHGVRVLRRSPALTAVALLTLALGIGANTLVFGLVNGTLLRPPVGVVEPDRLVHFHHTFRGNPFLISHPKLVEYREGNDVFSGMAGFSRFPAHLRTDGAPRRARGTLASGDYFPVLGLTASRGRLLVPGDDRRTGDEQVAVVSHELWRGIFGGAGDVVGSTVTLNDVPFTVVGVAPPGFGGTELGYRTDVWVPMANQPRVVPGRDRLDDLRNAWITSFARLRDGVDREVAEERMTALVQGSEQVAFGDGALLTPDIWVSPYLRGFLTEFNVLMLSVVGLVLLLTCANVANLLLAHATGRRAEIGMRMALGAGRLRLVGQLVTEGLLLAMAGGGLGLLLAIPGARLLAGLRLRVDLPLQAIDMTPDLRVLSANLTVSLVAGLAFAILPALRASRLDVAELLRTGPAASPAGGRLRDGLVVVQVAVSFVILVAAGLLLRSLLDLRSIDPGFDAGRVASVAVDLELEGLDEVAGAALRHRLLEGIRRIPGVEEVAAADAAPFTPAGSMRSSLASTVFLEGGDVPEAVPDGLSSPGGRILASESHVSAGYFRTLGIPLRAGRNFTTTANDPGGAAEGVPEIIVSEWTAEAFWPGESPLGQRLHLGAADGPLAEVVGVAGDVMSSTVSREPRGFPAIYLPLERHYRPFVTFLVRTPDAGAMVPRLQERLRELAPRLTTFMAGTLADRVDGSLWEERLTSTLLLAFGVLALSLASVGLYGVMAWSVGSRRPEIGVRRALGARRPDLVWMVVARGLRLTLAGLVLGVAGGVAAARLLESRIEGIPALDVATFAVIAILLAGVAILACVVPSRRALRVDPAVALRG